MKNLERQSRKFLPLTEATYLILASLTEPRHGYGIMQDVEAVSAGRVRIGPGTLYGALTNLLNQKLIARRGETGDGDSRRKIYALTALGEKVLVLEGERLASLSRLAVDVAKRLGGAQ
jgi:DNA-binding PadR family transcriptional regulator